MQPNITELIVEHDLCIGCGVCSGMCPANVLPMQFNKIGEYRPIEIEGCLDKCTFCIDVCPFIDSNDNEDQIGEALYAKDINSHHRVETGYYLNSYVAHNINEKERLKGASGGISTWLLKKLYNEKLIDHVVCISNNQDVEKLFDYNVYHDLSFLENNPGSVYYPVELSHAINYILKHPGKYAVTGLPCFIKSIRLAQQRNKKLRERIRFTLALTCGQMKSKYYTHHLAKLSGITEELKSVHYRGKDEKYKASNFYFSSMGVSGETNRLYWADGPKSVWTSRCYTPSACNYCDDVFGETADISVMDAWLSEYVNDYKGNSLILTRHALLDEIIKKGFNENALSGSSISIDTVIKSQQGVLNIKRDHLAYRLFLASNEGLKVPQKRINASKNLNWFIRKEIEIKYKIQKESKKLLDICGDVNLEMFHNTIKPLWKQLEKWQKIHMKVNFGKKIGNKLFKK